jgi:hypothetical protein
MDDAAANQMQGQALGYAAVALPGVGRKILLGKDGLSAALVQQGSEFIPWIAPTDNQAATSGTQVLIQATQATQQEGHPLRSDVGRI